MPFPCGEVWQGKTRYPHPSSSNSSLALDFNKGAGRDDEGEQVVASAAGTVTNRDSSRWGAVWIDHGDGWSTRYLHMSGITVQKGQQVKQGQVIGLVDDIGAANAWHLHYEQRLNGTLRHIRFNGTPVTYVLSPPNNGPSFTSRNCPTTTPAPAPILNARHYSTNNNENSGSAPAFDIGNSREEHFRGDWDGNGSDTPGRRIGNRFILSNNRNGTTPAHDFTYGGSEDEIVVGDWDGNGKDSIGLVRGNTWLLRNSLSTGNANVSFDFGSTGDEVVAGDWNGDGIDTPGVIRENKWFLHHNRNATGNADIEISYGSADDAKFVGDWDDDGIDTPGVRKGNAWYLRGSNGPSTAATQHAYGSATDLPVVGDWDGNGVDTIGVVRFG